MNRGNLFKGVDEARQQESFTELLAGQGFRLLRVVSNGHATPPGDWYDQDDDEWVVVLKGRGRLRLADGDTLVHMGPGDWILLPAHCRHRVEWTDPDQPTVWLALHRDTA